MPTADVRHMGYCGRRIPWGYTLIECLVVCALVGTASTLVLVAGRQHELRAGRLDAVDALTRIQLAQEQHRALHGMYSADLSALRSAPALSRQGRYQLQVQRSAGESYTAVATAQGPQSRDSACPALTLAVDQGYPQAGPSPACWNR
jgi:type IV pilus assembly protein PilE